MSDKGTNTCCLCHAPTDCTVFCEACDRRQDIEAMQKHLTVLRNELRNPIFTGEDKRQILQMIQETTEELIQLEEQKDAIRT